MSSQRLLFPEDVRAKLIKLYDSRKHEWLSSYSSHDWPLEIGLGCPTEEQAIKQQSTVVSWVAAWRAQLEQLQVTWHDRQWRRIGTQTIPEKVIFTGPHDVAVAIGETARWRRASERYTLLSHRWPHVSSQAKPLFEPLANYDDVEYELLQRVVQWFVENPSSGLYPRQLPVAGAHSKWLEGRLLLVCCLLACATARNDYTATLPFLGLRELPVSWRLRILDASIRQQPGGVGDMSAPIRDLQQLPISPTNVVIVENLQTFLAFQEFPETVVLMGMGFRVGELGTIGWVQFARCYYWGDLDSSGLAILDLARSLIPHVVSILMDEHTLLSHQHLWTEEKKQYPGQMLSHLSAEELSLYRALKEQQFGSNVRLEQERVPWDTAWRQLVQTISSAPRGTSITHTSPTQLITSLAANPISEPEI
jgi:hypothetical protein